MGALLSHLTVAVLLCAGPFVEGGALCPFGSAKQRHLPRCRHRHRQTGQRYILLFYIEVLRVHALKIMCIRSGRLCACTPKIARHTTSEPRTAGIIVCLPSLCKLSTRYDDGENAKSERNGQVILTKSVHFGPKHPSLRGRWYSRCRGAITGSPLKWFYGVYVCSSLPCRATRICERERWALREGLGGGEDQVLTPAFRTR